MNESMNVVGRLVLTKGSGMHNLTLPHHYNVFNDARAERRDVESKTFATC